MALVIVTASALVVRVYHLAYKSLWYDEGAFYWIAAQPLGDIIAHNAAENSGPPFFPFIVHAVLGYSTSVAALRGASCAAGIAAVVGVYLLAAEFVPPLFASVAAVLMAVSPAQVLRAQDAREYTSALVLAIGLLIVFVRFYRTPSWRLAGAFAALGAVSIFTQYGLAILVAALNVVMVAGLARHERLRRALPAWAGAQLCCVGAVLAVYELALRQQFSMANGTVYLASGYWGGTIRSLGYLLITGTYQIIDFAFPAPLMLVVTGLGAFAGLRSRELVPAVPLVVVPMLATLAAALVRAYPYLGGRQTIFLTPMIYVLAAIGVWYLWQTATSPVPAATMTIIMAGLGLARTIEYLRSTGIEDIRPLVEHVRQSAGADDHIYVYYGAAPVFGYYARGDPRTWMSGIASRSTPARYYQQLDPLVEDRHPLWLVFAHPYGDEVPSIVDYVRHRRSVSLVESRQNAWLFVAR